MVFTLFRGECTSHMEAVSTRGNTKWISFELINDKWRMQWIEGAFLN